MHDDPAAHLGQVPGDVVGLVDLTHRTDRGLDVI